MANSLKIPFPNAFPHGCGKASRPAGRCRFSIRRRLVAAVSGAAGIILVGGCAPAGPRSQPAVKSEGQALFGKPQDSPRSATGQTSENSWSIVIVAFRGPEQDAAARAGLAKAQTVGGLREAYTRREGGTTVIAYGRYSAPDSSDAQADLRRIRELNVDGGQPFAGAVLAPPSSAGTGRMPELDLRHARAEFGNGAVYSLQVAAYGRGDGPPRSEQERAEFVRAAEDAAAQLRREGEEAFYYHGPNMSIVTVGVFGPDDYDVQHPETRSDRLRAAEEAHPYNLLNGKGLWVRAKGVPENSPDARQMAASFLIAIPQEE